MTREKWVRVAMLRQIQLLKQRDWRDAQDEDVRKGKLWQQRSLLTNYNETVATTRQWLCAKGNGNKNKKVCKNRQHIFKFQGLWDF